MSRDRFDLAATALFATVRVALGGLWVHEGIFKLHAGFGRKDIELLVNSASNNSRVPEYFTFFAENLLHPVASIAGVTTPLTELGLGLVLIVGLFSTWTAVFSAGLLATYWSSDQLIWQYPIMALLSIGVVVGATHGDRWSVQALRRRSRV